MLTHKHFDHAGLAWKLIEAASPYQLKIYAHAEDIEEITHLDERINRFSSAKTDKLRAWGVPENELRTHAAYPIPPEWDMRPVQPQPLADNQSLDLGAGGGGGGGKLEVIRITLETEAGCHPFSAA